MIAPQAMAGGQGQLMHQDLVFLNQQTNLQRKARGLRNLQSSPADTASELGLREPSPYPVWAFTKH
jgi:hypothetical protein